MRRFFICIAILLICRVGIAACPRADAVMQQRGLVAAMSLYEHCAIQENDDATQYYLGQVYEKGREGIVRNIQRALLFYHLSAESGHADAQVSLAKLLTALDENDATRVEIASYLEKLKGMLQNNVLSSFRGDILHPYALLMLAAEKPDAKWFYNSSVLHSSRAMQAFKNYQITPEKKAIAIQAATEWKQRKMLERAQDVLSVEEYQDFYKTIYPKQGRSDDFTRTRFLQKLKEKTMEQK